MSLFKNSIVKPEKRPGDTISHQEWNTYINQLRIQTNTTTDILNQINELYVFEWRQVTDLKDLAYVNRFKLPPEFIISDISDLNNILNMTEYAASKKAFEVLEYQGQLFYSGPSKGDISVADIMIGTVKLHFENDMVVPLEGLLNIDGYQLETDDLVLVSGSGQDLDGIYRAKSGSWELKQKVLTNQVVSIERGDEYGGSQLKKQSNGTTTVVKYPERTFWKTIL